jgi:hypothetical protein
MRTHIVGVLFVIAACGGGGESAVEQYEQKAAKVGGKDVKITGCKARKFEGHAAAYFTLDSGHTVVMAATGEILVAKDSGEPKKVECASRSGGPSSSGASGDGAWVTGEGASLVCNVDGTELKLEVGAFDCGAKSRPSNEKK